MISDEDASSRRRVTGQEPCLSDYLRARISLIAAGGWVSAAFLG